MSEQPAPLVEVADDGKVYFLLDGERYEVAPTNPFEELELIRARAAEVRPDPRIAGNEAFKALDGLPESARDAMAEKLSDRLLADVQRWLNKAPANEREVAEFLDSEEGAAFTAWLRLRNNTGVDEAKAREIVKAVGLKAWLQHRDRMQQDLIEFAKKQKEAKAKAEQEEAERQQKEAKAAQERTEQEEQAAAP
jgi:hypothetical protein